MSACAMLTYNRVTREAWDCVKQAAAQYGIAGADAGTATINGFTVTWAYLEAQQVLHIQCVDSPFFVSCSMINSHINDRIATCLTRYGIEMSVAVPG